jgi:hypothetical protein
MHSNRSRRDSGSGIPTVERPPGRDALGRMLAVAAGLLLTALACALPASEGSGGDPVATAVAATLQAATGTAPEGPISPAVPTLAGEPPSAGDDLGEPAGSFSLAYTSGGEAWLIEGDGPERQLSTTGGVVQVVISSDGQRIAFARRERIDMPSEIWVVNRDGSGQTLLLASTRWNELYDHDEFLFNDLAGFAFLPGSYVLLLGTQGVPEGPGVFRYDDLLRLDADSGALTTLLPPGQGGAFSPSPDGETIAIVRPTSIGLVDADGSNLRPDLVTFPMIITYSEYLSYPKLTWSPDSRAVGAAIASADPLAADPSGTVWRIERDSAAASAGPAIPGNFFFTQFSAAALAPDLEQVAFGRAAGEPNITELYLGRADGSGLEMYISGDVSWKGWSPDGQHFVFSQDSPTNLKLGAPAAVPATLGDGHTLHWINPSEFVLLSGGEGSWNLSLGSIAGTLAPLASPSGDFVSFDVATR